MPDLTPARRERLLQAIDCAERAGVNGLSVQDAAKCLDMKVGPHLRGLLDELVGYGELSKEEDQVIKTDRGLRTGTKYFRISKQQ